MWRFPVGLGGNRVITLLTESIIAYETLALPVSFPNTKSAIFRAQERYSVFLWLSSRRHLVSQIPWLFLTSPPFYPYLQKDDLFRKQEGGATSYVLQLRQRLPLWRS